MRMTKLIAPRLKSIRDFTKLSNCNTTQLLEELSFIRNDGAQTTHLPIKSLIERKIEDSLRKDISTKDFQEINLGTLQQKKLWERSGRLTKFTDYMYFVDNLVLFPTTEEPVINLLSTIKFSYKELPVYVFGFRTLFRKSRDKQSVRSSQFRILDAYSFEHNTDSVRNSETYIFIPIIRRILDKLKIKYIEMYKDDNYKDFRIISEEGDDPIYINQHGEAFDKDPGNIDVKKLKSLSLAVVMRSDQHYSKLFKASYITKKNSIEPVSIGSFAAGIERLFYATAEQHRAKGDPLGFVWPDGFAPFERSIVEISGIDASDFYEKASRTGINMLYDDTDENIGVKIRRAYAIGIPEIVIIGKREKQTGIVSIERRDGNKYSIDFDRYLDQNKSNI